MPMLGLLPLLLVVGVVIAFLVARDRSDQDPPGPAGDDGHGTLRRAFVYSLALLGALLTASGLSGIVRVTLETFGGTALVSETDSGLALGLSLTIVGLPVWLLAWRAAQGGVAGSPAERRALGRRLFLAGVRAIALAIAVPYAIETGRWLVGADPYGAEAIARMLVWGLLWAYHERVAREVPFGSEHTRRIDRIEVYLAATGGFALLATSAGSLLARSLDALYELAVGVTPLVGRGIGPELRTTSVALVVGAVVWWWHWSVVAGDDTGSTGWFVYLFLVGVLSGTATVVISGSVVLHRVLAWFLGAADRSAGGYFDVLPASVAGLLVGIAVWGYHRAALRETEPAGDGRWSGPERIYRYLVTAAGMLTAAGGIATILMVGLDVAVPGRTVVEASGGLRDVVAIGLTLLLIGVPLWAWSWSAVQRRVRERPEERNALARRVLIFGAFGVAIVTTVVALSVLLFELFEATLAGELSDRLIEQQRWSIALLLTAGAVSVHYGLVLREDRAGAPEEPVAVQLGRIILVASDPASLAAELRTRFDAEVTAWERTDVEAQEAAPLDVDRVTAALRQVQARRALVVVDADGSSRIIPLQG